MRALRLPWMDAAFAGDGVLDASEVPVISCDAPSWMYWVWALGGVVLVWVVGYTVWDEWVRK